MPMAGADPKNARHGARVQAAPENPTKASFQGDHPVHTAETRGASGTQSMHGLTSQPALEIAKASLPFKRPTRSLPDYIMQKMRMHQNEGLMHFLHDFPAR